METKKKKYSGQIVLLPITLIVRSDEVSYDVPCSPSCNKIKLQANKTFSAWTIPGLKD